MSDEGQDQVEVADERQGTARVVLRAVRAIALDGLTADQQRAVLNAAGTTEAVETCTLWKPVALRYGTVEAAIRAVAGASGKDANVPGTYRAVPENSWGVSPQVIEPALG